MRTLSFCALLLGAVPLSAQQSPARPIPYAASPIFDSGLVLGGEWMQVAALPLDRDALHSNGFDLGWRSNGWSFNVGWLRVARDLSSLQGGTASVGRLFPLGPVTLIPAVSVLGGQAYVSVDSTGYDYTDPATGVTGHVPRYSYSEGAVFGAGAGLTVEVPVYRMIGLRASATQWFFGGNPVADDRARTVVGLGLSLRVWQ